MYLLFRYNSRRTCLSSSFPEVAGLRPEALLSSSELLPPDFDFGEPSGSDFDLLEPLDPDLLDVTDDAEESLPEPDLDLPLPELLSESEEFFLSDSEPESSAAHYGNHRQPVQQKWKKGTPKTPNFFCYSLISRELAAVNVSELLS